ncbi:hypothetical protein EXIGLDRAFT_15336 [Exidia glandulosa HHB12029]|uniref:Diphthine--ammonia ligase n=1 Tax=Exidia glandulosa HHB12029 TaxID=1314781 RepID=A0A165QUT2_EXIGL|nr:hypothetical protein EXIGLDRAFT_15336 [Exidia glandulosa HHB12029]
MTFGMLRQTERAPPLSHMKFVGLLSGGKDSCYNLVHCVHNGHELVAAATLSPPQGKDEIDSYLYQTVGQDAIDLVAQALDVPLYRRVIEGAAIELGNEYGGRTRQDASRVEGDETEDLYDLLSNVKAHHPDVEGVAIGAILSNYQRVRMEHVCRRLGLTPLCYLWQRDQRELLSEMIEAGMECILIKVAGIGLTTKHLGKTLAEMQPTLWKLNDQFGLHVCGEGGEYETLTLDCPLFKKRIHAQETETIIHSDSSFGTVAFLKFKSAELVDKPSVAEVSQPLVVPPLLDDVGQEVRAATDARIPPGASISPAPHVTPTSVVSSVQSGQWISVANVQISQIAEEPLPFEEEVRYAFALLQDTLAKHQLSLRHVASMDVLLSSMDLFPILNGIYAEHFATSPPARACVAVDLPPPNRVVLSCIAYAKCDTPQDRQALHVQGLSYWAPANIGPYSQAVTTGDHIFISGQIGLVPASMTLPTGNDLAFETALSFQHVRRVLAAVAPAGIVHGAVIWLTSLDQVDNVRKGWEVDTQKRGIPTLFIGAQSLPKGALVETQVVSHTGTVDAVDEDGDAVRSNVVQAFSQCVEPICWMRSTLSGLHTYMNIAFDIPDIALVLNLLTALPGDILQIRLFYSAVLSAETVARLTGSLKSRPVSPIPVRFIACGEKNNWNFGMSVLAVGK